MHHRCTPGHAYGGLYGLKNTSSSVTTTNPIEALLHCNKRTQRHDSWTYLRPYGRPYVWPYVCPSPLRCEVGEHAGQKATSGVCSADWHACDRRAGPTITQRHSDEFAGCRPSPAPIPSRSISEHRPRAVVIPPMLAPPLTSTSSGT